MQEARYVFYKFIGMRQEWRMRRTFDYRYPRGWQFRRHVLRCVQRRERITGSGDHQRRLTNAGQSGAQITVA